MLHRPPRTAALLLGVLLVCLSGCVKFKQAYTVYPDGSGKMHVSMAISEQMLAMAGDEDPFADFSLDKLAAHEAAGWAAFTPPQISVVDGVKTVAFTGYFEDINAVRFGDAGHQEQAQAELPQADAETGVEAAPQAAAELKPFTAFHLGDQRLTVTGGVVAQMVSKMGHDPSFNDPATRAMVAPIIQGLEISETYRLPGVIQQADGYTTDGRTATLVIRSEDLLGAPRFTVAALEDGTAEFTFAPAPWDDQNAWRAEFDAARAAWNQLKPQAIPAADTPEPVGSTP